MARQAKKSGVIDTFDMNEHHQRKLGEAIAQIDDVLCDYTVSGNMIQGEWAAVGQLAILQRRLQLLQNSFGMRQEGER